MGGTPRTSGWVRIHKLRCVRIPKIRFSPQCEALFEAEKLGLGPVLTKKRKRAQCGAGQRSRAPLAGAHCKYFDLFSHLSPESRSFWGAEKSGEMLRAQSEAGSERGALIYSN